MLTGLTRLFGLTPALVRVDLRVEAGEAVLLHGPNGAGKTTLLRTIATRLAPTYGTGTVLGFDLESEREEIRRRSELVGHSTGLYADLTAYENLAFTAALSGRFPGAEILAALDRVGLAEHARRRVGGFSQGMRQRLPLARAFLRRPELLLLDEPYAALDEAGKGLVDALILEGRTEGRTVLVATHDVSRAQGMAERAVGMDRGRIVSDASLREGRPGR